ncbi:hypothetical protein GLOTRDRAFT_97407 [Gloeophyllum trabeum ATCC 11539]|uniref:DUF6534 domain-containing protein n=1 Tax=Gloeophyllum trabeum (strain ATCC 11539 / FP-39264 / Madison 617) TaxID=670483 RepID=S7RYK0_GLOTA|nr:uncharacterized protein GLOTRDRAFT_97407 [Gloeophyllum trabeum ATCC 11539]EPQ59990.1 hypothetical protein GLOTRDRAFT_97407 [Gloeophyllum trabeum ATCC 11539]
MPFDVSKALGAVLLGSLISLGLSGIVSMQSFLYFRTFRADYRRVKATVSVVWGLDLFHSGLICAGAWQYLIESWGNNSTLDTIPIPIALTIIVTAFVTFIVHSFFTHRVLVLSKHNWWICAPMWILAFFRLVCATTTTGLMISVRSFDTFLNRYTWIFTLGLATSAAVDVLIAVSLCYFLRSNRTGFGSMDYVIDTIMLYTINNGSLTSISTIISLVCWLAMPHNLIFMGFHFAISKLYANSFLATLNTRESLRSRGQGSSERDYPMPVIFQGRLTTDRFGMQNEVTTLDQRTTKLQISVEKTIHVDGDEGMEQSDGTSH